MKDYEPLIIEARDLLRQGRVIEAYDVLGKAKVNSDDDNLMANVMLVSVVIIILIMFPVTLWLLI